MDTIRVKRLQPGAKLPYRATPDATGYDLFACLNAESLMVGQEPVRVPTGLAVETPSGYDVQIRPRSGLSFNGVMVTYGTIDADYRGELLVTMYTLPYREPHVVHDGDRIAQLVISRIAEVNLVETEELSESVRGAGGHGSTGR
ncbi:MAG TPA: dUTP diphosphatase [Dehalococcoidia bacterium]|nr:dUTP diphosphatase [Dehalococcoidia bacterium]